MKLNKGHTMVLGNKLDISSHAYLFDELFAFAGQVRDVNLAKGNFRFAPVMYLRQSLTHISAMPQQNFEQIIEKYVEMNVAHPFRDGNPKMPNRFRASFRNSIETLCRRLHKSTTCG